MDATAVTVRNMLDTLEEEDYKMAVITSSSFTTPGKSRVCEFPGFKAVMFW